MTVFLLWKTKADILMNDFLYTLKVSRVQNNTDFFHYIEKKEKKVSTQVWNDIKESK